MSDAVCARTAELLARLVPGDNRPLVPEDLVCLCGLLEPRDSGEAPMQLQTLQKTQLAHKLGLLLGRLLDQHRVRPFGWQREGYCSMVDTTAQGTCSVIGCAADSDHSPLTPAQKSAQLVVVQQITSSGLLPKLATALSKLADMVQATEQKSPFYKPAALALLQLAANLIAIWPGTGGVLTSAAASATVAPAVQLAVAMMQHNITAPESCIHESEAALEFACRLVTYLGSTLMDERYRRTRLPQALQGVSVVMAGLASPAFQQLVLTVVALVTDPRHIVAGVFCTVNVDEDSMAAATEGQQTAAVAASDAAQGPLATDAKSRASVADGDSSSTARHDSSSSSSGDTDGVAAQHVELCQQQRLLLQMLYPALGSSSKWADFAAVSAAALSRMALTFTDFQCITEAAIVCFDSVNDSLPNVGESASASSSSRTSRGQGSRTATPAMSASSLNVLLQLPVLLLQWAYVAASTPEAYLDRSAIYEAVASLSYVALNCWWGQMGLNRSHASVSEEVDSRDQLPAARISELMLQNMRLLQQQQQALASRAVTATAREAVSPRGSAAAAPAAPLTEMGTIDMMVGIGAVNQLSQLMCKLKPSLGTAVWHPVSNEVYSMLEWWLRVGSSSHEEQQQQPQCSEGLSSSSSALVAVQWSDGPHFRRLYDNGLLSDAVCSYYQVTRICEAWLNPTAVIYQADAPIMWCDSVMLPCAAAAAPGSSERQQLLTLLISLLKKSSNTNGLLTLTPTGPVGAVTSGCELGCVVAAVKHMLSLCGPCGSSSATGGPCSSRATEDSSRNQGTCTTTAGTTSRDGISSSISSGSSNITSDGCNVNKNSAVAGQAAAATAAAATAAAPWMVVAARALINKAERLSGCLEYQPEAPDIHGVLRDMHKALSRETESAMLRPRDSANAAAVDALLAKVKQMFSDESVELVEYIQPFLHWSQCVRHIICALETALLGLTGRQGSASGSTTLIGSAVAADSSSSSNSTVHSAGGPAAAAGVQPQTPAAPAVTVASVQQAQFGSALQQLQSSFPKLQQLTEICSLLAPMSHLSRELEPAQWLLDINKLGLAAEVVEALRTTSSIDAFRDALQLWGVQQLQQQLFEAGQLVCAAFPLKYFCNSPMCRNLSKSTETDLVNGKGCVCARCETARYCSRDCQAAHWPWHKAICKAIKKQSRSSS